MWITQQSPKEEVEISHKWTQLYNEEKTNYVEQEEEKEKGRALNRAIFGTDANTRKQTGFHIYSQQRELGKMLIPLEMIIIKLDYSTTPGTVNQNYKNIDWYHYRRYKSLTKNLSIC